MLSSAWSSFSTSLIFLLFSYFLQIFWTLLQFLLNFQCVYFGMVPGVNILLSGALFSKIRNSSGFLLGNSLLLECFYKHEICYSLSLNCNFCGSALGWDDLHFSCQKFVHRKYVSSVTQTRMRSISRNPQKCFLIWHALKFKGWKSSFMAQNHIYNLYYIWIKILL